MAAAFDISSWVESSVVQIDEEDVYRLVADEEDAMGDRKMKRLDCIMILPGGEAPFDDSFMRVLIII